MNKFGEKRYIMNTSGKRKARWIWCILRHDGVQKTIIEGLLREPEAEEGGKQ